MKLIEYHKAFLENTVNLNDSRIALLDERVEAISDFLEQSEIFSGVFIATIPQGSYAHKTIIKPVQDGDEFDADILLALTEVEDWDAKDYVQKLYQAFRDSSVYRDMVSRKTRCVTVDYTGDFHVDVVPYLERHSENYVTNRHEDIFELTNPEGFTFWLDERNRITSRDFARVVRLVKYIRDFKETFHVKSIILSTLLGNQVSDGALLADPNCYMDIPTTLRTVMNALAAYLDLHPELPTIEDPSGTGENFSDRWNQEQYRNFREWIIYYADKIDRAYTEPDKTESLKLWQEVFGPDFIAPAPAVTKASVSESYRRTEQSLGDLGIPMRIDPRYRVRVSARVLEKPGFRGLDLAKLGNKVRSGRHIRFTATCNAALPFKVYWKILNRGAEARRRDCVRGEIKEGGMRWERDEPTAFRGEHFVECYIVKDDVCVATDRQEVLIT